MGCSQVLGYKLILQHCDKDVEQRIESYGNWEVCNTVQDPIELLKLIRSALHKHDDVKQGIMAYIEQDIRLFTMWQKPDQSPLEFVKQVKAQVDVINVHGGRAGYHPELYKAHLAESTPATELQQKASVRNILLVLQFALQTTLVSRSLKMSWTTTF
jgi:hypothetical protein